jgi:small glutamine-rich tetratricopeptide repeat-containing protein alpha
MNKDENEAAYECFHKAAEIEPENETYQNNLKVAQERIEAQLSAEGVNPFAGFFPPGMGMPGGGMPGMGGMDPSTFLNNPAFLQMATRVMQDPNMQQM